MSINPSFDEFAERLIKTLETTIASVPKCSSADVQREKCWSAFHSARLSTLIDLWDEMLGGVGERLDPLVQQYVNQLFENMMVSKIDSCMQNPSKPVQRPRTSCYLAPDEENIIRYMLRVMFPAHMVLLKTHKKD